VRRRRPRLRLGALQSAIEPRLHDEIRAAPELREARQQLLDLIERITAGAQAEGAMRPDIGAGDVGLLMTVQIYAPPHLPDEQATRRVVDIMLDGMRTSDVHPGPATT
jgi:hypothetical protein